MHRELVTQYVYKDLLGSPHCKTWDGVKVLSCLIPTLAVC